ncbi:hypothetical protein LR948_11265 [Roseivivax sp. GX 12232]|uniref:hypothetical protein n=1 Tax=Roseivivax sp. GX 12232 TaxID=2900547 RepID=UPI001E5D109E|nr:hypothetical protein [Roseivivax sp. GX 12232]MCE0505939.1 hypothetical protein [Roseivivax sp. GX 12232]
MTQDNTLLSLADLRAHIEASTPPAERASILAFLDLARAALGQEFFRDPSVLASEADFSGRLPKAPDEALAASFGDAAFYGRCRESILRHAKIAGLWADTDPYTLLNEVARSFGLAGVNRRIMEATFPGLAPRYVTREMAIQADRGLRGFDRQEFRACMAALDRVRSDPRISAAGILGPEPIGLLPRYRDGDRNRIDLPEDALSVLPRLIASHARRARRAFELAVDFGILAPSGPAKGWSLSQEEAARYHARVGEIVSLAAASDNLRALTALLRRWRPSSVPENLSVDRVCNPKREPAKTRPAPKKTDRQPATLPQALNAEVAAYVAKRGLSRKPATTLRRVLRCLLAAGWHPEDGISISQATAILQREKPRLGAGSLQVYRSLLKGFLRHIECLAPWDDLLARASDVGGMNLRGLSALAELADDMIPPVVPDGIDGDRAKELVARAQERGTGTQVRQGLQALDRLREVLPELPSIPVMPALKDDTIPKQLASEIRAQAQAAGYSPQGIRARLVAVRALYRLAPDRARFSGPVASIAWQEIIDAVLVQYPKEMEPYRNELRRFARQAAEKWSAGWKDLQSRIVATGIPKADNPVAHLATVAVRDGREPWQIDREWAWTHERSLRADLRHTWSRAVDHFDALRKHPEIATSGLLPADQLGPMPETGSRLKNAHLPLPRRVEAALEGESKQIFEAAHFIWRCLRALGTHAKHDNPGARALLAEVNLELVLEKQTFMTHHSARLHVARLRDWRESRPGLA